MYSPDISQHSPRLYRLGRRYRQPMTRLADRLISFGLDRLEEVFGPAPVDPAEEARLVAEDPAPYGARPSPLKGTGSLQPPVACVKRSPT